MSLSSVQFGAFPDVPHAAVSMAFTAQGCDLLNVKRKTNLNLARSCKQQVHHPVTVCARISKNMQISAGACDAASHRNGQRGCKTSWTGGVLFVVFVVCEATDAVLTEHIRLTRLLWLIICMRQIFFRTFWVLAAAATEYFCLLHNVHDQFPVKMLTN